MDKDKIHSAINNAVRDVEPEGNAESAATLSGTIYGQLDLDAKPVVLTINNAQKYATKADFPEEGDVNVTYLDVETSKLWHWNGTAYVPWVAATTKDYEQVKTQVQNNTTAISEIEGKIPNQASAQNLLADKAFVNSSIATNTAFYISDGGKPFQSLADLESYEGALTNNDYAFVVGQDTAGNTTYTRYKWSEATEAWSEEYVLNNSSFTAEQWEAISSGITSGLVAKLGALPTASELATQLLAKYEKPSTGIPKDDLSAAVQTSLSKADTSVQSSDLAGYIPFANLLGEYGKTSVAIGYLASVVYRSQANINAIALGRKAKVWAAGGVAIGQYGIAADEDAVVITANLVGDQTYPSHGIGTLNFGSRSGMRGIFIQHMHIDAALAFLLANIDERGNVNSFLCEYGDWQYSYGEGWVAGQYFSHGGRLYKVLQNIEEYTEWEDVPPTSYEEITLQKVLFASPAFTGTPTAPTPAANDNSTKVATTAFVKTAISGISVTPLSGRTFSFATTQGVMDALKATIEALGGTVVNAPESPAQNNQTQGE